jgi:hypothetical protein
MVLRRSFLMLMPAAAMAAPQWEEILGRVLGGRGDDRIALGLKEALSVGTGNAVLQLGRRDGYFTNLAVKILLPDNLRKAESALRMVGMGKMLDDLVLGMNRAAERAAPFARQIFFDAIKRMTFSDVRRIFTGGDTAATEYFRNATTDQLIAAFSPPVAEAMNEVGVVRTFNDLFARVQRVPFVRVEKFDLERYVVSRALAGLFYVVGEEEKKIRRDPAARVTAILREVFGRR